MDDYISRETAIEAIENADADVCEQYADGFCDWGYGKKNIVSTLRKIPAADVAPVRHGKFDNVMYMCGTYSGHCSECGKFSGLWHKNMPYLFCPYCGTKMDLEDEK